MLLRLPSCQRAGWGLRLGLGRVEPRQHDSLNQGRMAASLCSFIMQWTKGSICGQTIANSTFIPRNSFIRSPHFSRNEPYRADKSTDKLGETARERLSHHPLVSDSKSPRVLIAGAGLGGLFLAILLDRAGIPYEIFERMSEIKSLDSVIGLSSCILPVWWQLGIEQELDAITPPNTSLQIVYGSMEKVATLDSRNQRESVVRHIVLKWLPQSIKDRAMRKTQKSKERLTDPKLHSCLWRLGGDQAPEAVMALRGGAAKEKELEKEAVIVESITV